MKKIALLLTLTIQIPFAVGAEPARAARFVPPDSAPSRSPLQLAAIDFLIPGYGTFTQDKTLYATIYCGTNVVTIGLAYLAYRNWQYYESAYQAALVRQSTEPDALYFADPTGGDAYLSLQDIRNRSERGQLFFAVSIIANVALRLFSATHTWLLADEARTKSGPRYEFYSDEKNGYRITTGYQFVF